MSDLRAMLGDRYSDAMARTAAAAPWPAAAQLAAKFDLAARVLEATEQRDGRACWLRLVVTP